MRLVVGLGNPGPRYVGTRHNVGFRIASALADRFGFGWSDSPRYTGRVARGQAAAASAGGESHELVVLMPASFMNASGESVGAAARALGIAPETELLVAFDDLDLPFGQLRLRAAGGCGGHRGMESIAAALGSERFARLRFGIDRPPTGGDVTRYVLSPFADVEEARLPQRLARASDAIAALLEEGIDAAMERYNRSDDEDGSSSRVPVKT